MMLQQHTNEFNQSADNRAKAEIEAQLTWLKDQLASKLHVPAITVRLYAILALQQWANNKGCSLTQSCKVAELSGIRLGG